MSPVDTITDNDIFSMRFKMNFTNTVCALALFLAIALDRNVGTVIAGLGLIGRAVIDLARAWRGHSETK